ncbi:MAG: hypothetical protein ACK5TU_17930 [Cyclobacteriaceae bacterium]|jgi:hypothetical protein
MILAWTVFVRAIFWVTEAAFHTSRMGYNLMSLFSEIVPQSKSQVTLSTLRFMPLWREGSWITKQQEKQHSTSQLLEKNEYGWIVCLIDYVRQKHQRLNSLMHNLG